MLIEFKMFDAHTHAVNSVINFGCRHAAGADVEASSASRSYLGLWVLLKEPNLPYDRGYSPTREPAIYDFKSLSVFFRTTGM